VFFFLRRCKNGTGTTSFEDKDQEKEHWAAVSDLHFRALLNLLQGKSWSTTVAWRAAVSGAEGHSGEVDGCLEEDRVWRRAAGQSSRAKHRRRRFVLIYAVGSSVNELDVHRQRVDSQVVR
jgi:hypothetical protein